MGPIRDELRRLSGQYWSKAVRRLNRKGIPAVAGTAKAAPSQKTGQKGCRRRFSIATATPETGPKATDAQVRLSLPHQCSYILHFASKRFERPRLYDPNSRPTYLRFCGITPSSGNHRTSISFSCRLDGPPLADLDGTSFCQFCTYKV